MSCGEFCRQILEGGREGLRIAGIESTEEFACSQASEVRTECLLAENILYELPVLQAPHPGPLAKWLLPIALSTNIPGLTQENLLQNIEDSYN